MKDQTFLARLGTFNNPEEGSMSTPISTSTSFIYEPSQENVPTYYSRTGNLTRDVLQSAIAFLERGNQGFAASSGMAAIALSLGATLKAGDTILTSVDLYGGTLEYFKDLSKKNIYNIKYAFDETDILNQINDNTDVVYLESPSNPLMTTFNISKIAEKAHKFGAYLIIDNTFFSPLNQKPLTMGADIVIHSATKYISGHHDVIAGLVVSNKDELCDKLDFSLSHSGSILSPIDSWLVIRGMKTLAVRMKIHEYNVEKVINAIDSEPLVERILYGGKSGIFSIKLKDRNKSEQFCKSLKQICYAVSLGGTETSITIPFQETHIGVDDDLKIKYGLDESIIRISVGLEDVDDIITDLKQAFDEIR